MPKKEQPQPDEAINTELESCKIALIELEKNSGGQDKDIFLVSSEKPKAIELPDFGSVVINEFTITGRFLFIQAEGEKVKFDHSRLGLIRPAGREEIIACQRPQVFLKPNREITPEDLNGDSLWAKPFIPQGELELIKFIRQTVDRLTWPNYDGKYGAISIN